MVGFVVGWIWGGLLKKNGREMEKFAIFWAEPVSGTGTHSAEEKWHRYQSK